jgi:hypothetical protein
VALLSFISHPNESLFAGTVYMSIGFCLREGEMQGKKAVRVQRERAMKR